VFPWRGRTRAAAACVALVLTACAGGGTSGEGGGAYPCDDAGLAPGRPADVCGPVTRVLRARRTRTGTHGYFYVRVAPGNDVEVVSNLDAMARAPSNRPPAAWPWVAPGDYVYVRGRYYDDGDGRRGIDWTEDDTSRRWPFTGYVAVCDAARARCTKFW
jgi:hypothetical protein